MSRRSNWLDDGGKASDSTKNLLSKSVRINEHHNQEHIFDETTDHNDPTENTITSVTNNSESTDVIVETVSSTTSKSRKWALIGAGAATAVVGAAVTVAAITMRPFRNKDDEDNSPAEDAEDLLDEDDVRHVVDMFRRSNHSVGGGGGGGGPPIDPTVVNQMAVTASKSACSSAASGVAAAGTASMAVSAATVAITVPAVVTTTLATAAAAAGITAGVVALNNQVQMDLVCNNIQDPDFFEGSVSIDFIGGLNRNLTAQEADVVTEAFKSSYNDIYNCEEGFSRQLLTCSVCDENGDCCGKIQDDRIRCIFQCEVHCKGCSPREPLFFEGEGEYYEQLRQLEEISERGGDENLALGRDLQEDDMSNDCSPQCAVTESVAEIYCSFTDNPESCSFVQSFSRDMFFEDFVSLSTYQNPEYGQDNNIITKSIVTTSPPTSAPVLFTINTYIDWYNPPVANSTNPWYVKRVGDVWIVLGGKENVRRDGEITCLYDIPIDKANINSARLTLYEDDCLTPLNDGDDGVLRVSNAFIAPSVSSPAGSVLTRYVVEVDVDTTIIALYDNIWNSNLNTLSFCILIELLAHVLDGKTESISFRESVVIAPIDLTAGYSTTPSVHKTETTDYG